MYMYSSPRRARDVIGQLHCVSYSYMYMYSHVTNLHNCILLVICWVDPTYVDITVTFNQHYLYYSLDPPVLSKPGRPFP